MNFLYQLKQLDEKMNGQAVLEKKSSYIGDLKKLSSRFDKIEGDVQAINHALKKTLKGHAIMDLNGRYKEVSKEYADILGVAPEVLIGEHWSKTVDPKDLEFVTQAYEDMLKGGLGQVVARGVRDDGTKFKKLISLVAPRGKIAEYYCFMTDLSKLEHGGAP